MNVLKSTAVLFRALGWTSPRTKLTQQISCVSRPGPTIPGWRRCSLWSSSEGGRLLQLVPGVQQVRTVKRGTEYQPKNMKRKRTHGWLKRISTQGGIEVILRRMLKRRKSLTH